MTSVAGTGEPSDGLIQIEPSLITSAAVAGDASGRTAIQQLEHWARVGRELDSLTTAKFAAQSVIDGHAAYDDVDLAAQVIVRSTWDEGIGSRLGALNFAMEFESAGETWTDGLADGSAVARSRADGNPTAS